MSTPAISTIEPQVSEHRRLGSSSLRAHPQEYTAHFANALRFAVCDLFSLTDAGARRASVLVALFQRGLLRGRSLFLVLHLPLLIRHAVDDLAALVLAQRETLGVGGFLHPVAEAIAAEARKVHQIDVLHVGARTQMLDQTAEHRGFELGLGLGVNGHGGVLVLSPCNMGPD